MGEHGSPDLDDPGYLKVFAALDELDFSILKPLFKEKHFRDRTLSYVKSEQELKDILKEELELPFGQRFEFSRLWFEKYHGNDVVTTDQSKKEAARNNSVKEPNEGGKQSSSTSIESVFVIANLENVKIDGPKATWDQSEKTEIFSDDKESVHRENVSNQMSTAQSERKGDPTGRQCLRKNGPDQTESGSNICSTGPNVDRVDDKGKGSVAENTARSTVTNVEARETSTQENRATSNVNFKDRLPKINNSDREEETSTKTHAGNSDKGTPPDDTESREINIQDKGAVTNVINKNLMPLIDNRETHEATDVVAEKHSEIPQKEGAIDDRLGEEADKLSNDQSNPKRNAKKKAKKKKKASKETGNTGTNTGVNEEMREGSEVETAAGATGKPEAKASALNHIGLSTTLPQNSAKDSKATEDLDISGDTSVTVGLQASVATGELTSTVNDIIHAQSHPGGSGNAVVTTANNDQDRTSASETIESTSKIDNEACPESGIQELVPSGVPSPLTKRSDLDGVGNVDQAREPVERELSEKQDDPRKSYTGVRRCTPRARGVKGRDTFYEKGSVFDAEENRELEFKSLVNAQQSSLPWKIMEKAKKFICACLNVGNRGTIYFGVGDSQEKNSKYQHGEILGLDVELIKDDINKAFQFVLDDHIRSDGGPLQKGGEQNCVTIHFVPVKIQGKRSNLYVIEIEVTREWRFCKENIYYSKSWAEKRGGDKDSIGKKALSDFFKVKDEFDDVAIRTNGASCCVKQVEVDRQVRKPLEARYKEWKQKSKHGGNEITEEINVEEADAKRFNAALRERLRELNHKDYGYILIANKLSAHHRGSAHLSFLQNIPWVAVFDLFDSSSKRDGLHFACNETTDAPRANVRTLGDFKEVTPDKDSFVSTRGTTWILSDEEMQKGDWIKCSKDCLYRALSAYKQCFLPGRLVCVFLCFNESAVNEMADIMESSFSILGNSASSCVTIVSESKQIADAFINASKPSLQKEITECSITGIPWILFREIVREMVGPSKFEEKGARTELPYFTGQMKEVLKKIVHSWDDLEVYCPNPGLPRSTEAIEKERGEFYKGAQASQINLSQNHSIPRTLEKKLSGKVEWALKSLCKENIDANYHMKTVTLSYEPGSGATTLCRRILWNKRTEYRCAVVKAITSSTDFQIEKLQSIGYDETNMNYSLPVLVLVDNFPERDVHLLTDHIIKRQTKCVVLTTLPISTSVTNSKFEITLGTLDEQETSLVKDILINITDDTEKRREAEQVLEREKRFIWFGLELFGREYLKIKERLQNHIRSTLETFLTGDPSGEAQTLLEMCCFLSKYSDGYVILPHSVVLDFIFQTSTWANREGPDVNEVHDMFGGLLREEQNETNGYYGWRPAHPLVSEVVTSRISVEGTAIRSLELVCKGKAYVIKFLRQQVFRMLLDRKRISDPVFFKEEQTDDGVVSTDLENEVFGFYGKRTRFSPVIMDILEKEGNSQGALRVLLSICEQATQTEDKAYAWQQLARFMGYEMRAKGMDEQDELDKRLYSAMTKERPVKLPMPRNGIVAAHTAVDIAVFLQPSFTHHYSTKGVLYLSQLRDLKPRPQLRSLPEAIEICRKALSVYDKALETSRGPNHFSMIGKIQAIISLLEIVKDIPCFQSERNFQAYLKKEEVPQEMGKVLSSDEQDYIQSLSSTTLEILNELFGSVKLMQTTTYDENEIRSLNNAKIRASNLRRKFYDITKFDKSELSSEEYSISLSPTTIQELGLYQQKVQDILFIYDETPYSTWSKISDKEVELIYQLLQSLCLRGSGSHNDMLICSKACLQLKERPPVDELDKVVNIWVDKASRSEWAHLFYYMIHFPVPNGSLAPCNAKAKASIKKCATIVQEKAGSGFRKSGAEYFLGKGKGLNAIVSGHEFHTLNRTWKTKTDFWRGKEPSERLERVKGQKESKGIISYQGIQLHFDDTLYPKESKDDLWFYVGFTLAGPYAYDPVDNDTYASLQHYAPRSSGSAADRSTPGNKSGGSSSNHGTRGKVRLSTKWHRQDGASARERNIDQTSRRGVDPDDPQVFQSRYPPARSGVRGIRNGDLDQETDCGLTREDDFGSRCDTTGATSSQRESKSGGNSHGPAFLQERSAPNDKLEASSSRHGASGDVPLSTKTSSWSSKDAASSGEDDVDENTHDTDSDDEVLSNDDWGCGEDWITVGNRFAPLRGGASASPPQKERKLGWSSQKPAVSEKKAVEGKRNKASDNLTEERRLKSEADKTSVVGTLSGRRKRFDLKRVSFDGRLHHGAFVRGVKKSQECCKHISRADARLIHSCNFAHSWCGDTLQFVCTKCTEANLYYCKEKVKHEQFIWNLGPYKNRCGEVWTEVDALYMSNVVVEAE